MDHQEPSEAKRIVAEGYDRIAATHQRWASTVRAEERARYTAVLLDRLPPGTRVLELGCGAGLPTTRQLAEHFRVTGVDISAEQLALARRNVPNAHFLLADMASLDLAAGSLHGVAAFYALIHLPRDEQPALLLKIATWLRPGGLLVATLGAQDIAAGYEADWLGAPMYWSSFDAETNRRLVEEAGLEILSAREETADEFGQPVTFLWVVAQKPAPGVAGILNYLPISEQIGTAGQPTRAQFADLRAAGYELVVNLALPDSTHALPDEAALVAEAGMDCVHIPVVWEAPTTKDLDEFFLVMDIFQDRPVFVHCAMNMRVSAFVLLYRVIRQGVPLPDAWEALRLIWEPNPTWAQFVADALAHHGYAIPVKAA